MHNSSHIIRYNIRMEKAMAPPKKIQPNKEHNEEGVALGCGYDSHNLSPIVDKYSDQIIRIAYQYTKCMSDAEDIAQEVFIRLLKEPLMNNEHELAWIVRVTINLCKDFKKSFWFRKTKFIDVDHIAFTPLQNNILEDIQRLPDNYRNVLYLYYFEKYTISEISAIMKINSNTIGSWLNRARRKLKLIIDQEEE